MGVYAEQVLPRIVNAACGMKVTQPLRQRVCEGLGGDVVEIGFGSGHNVPYYPAAVSSVAAIEPADLGWKLARDRLAATSVLVERKGLDGQKLPLADDSVDAALTTWSLCTIPDPLAALLELRRVLKPGGTIHFLEHGLAPDENVPALAASRRAASEADLRRLSPHPLVRRPTEGGRIPRSCRSTSSTRRAHPRSSMPSSLGVATAA